MNDLKYKVGMLALEIFEPKVNGVMITQEHLLLKVEQIITLIREQIAKDIEAYAKTQEKTMQKAAYQCAAIARGKVGE